MQINDCFLTLLNRESHYRYYVFYGGRDAAKSWGVGICFISLAYTNRNLLFLCAKGTMNSLDDSVKRLLESIIYHMELEDFFHITDNEIVCTLTNSRFIFKGLQKPERLKSLEGVDYCWIEEGNVDTKEDTFEKLIPTIRKPNSKIVITFNPFKTEDYVYERFVNNKTDNDYVVKLTFRDNMFLSEESKNEMQLVKETNLAAYLHIYEGQVKSNPEGALFKIEWFKYSTSPIYDKVIVALDPSGTSHDKSDACGIVVVAQRGNFYYILDDQTAVMSPGAWAAKSIQLYEKYKANYIVAETNFGADMIKTIIKQIEPSIPIRDVHASRGKLIRAEPIAALYEQGLVYHVKRFPELEYEMTTYTGDPKQKSPNRLDAAVWGVSSLMKGNVKVPSAVGIRF